METRKYLKWKNKQIAELRKTASKPFDQLLTELNAQSDVPWEQWRVSLLQICLRVEAANLERSDRRMIFQKRPPLGKPPVWVRKPEEVIRRSPRLNLKKK